MYLYKNKFELYKLNSKQAVCQTNVREQVGSNYCFHIMDLGETLGVCICKKLMTHSHVDTNVFW